MSLRSLFSVRDVTQGRPWKRLMELAIPLLIGNVAQQLYNTVDTIIVGRYVGDDALSAVGAAGPIMNLLFVLFVGLAVGAGIMVAQRFGAKDREGLTRVIGNVLILTVLISIITTALGLVLTLAPIFGGKTLLQLMKTPEGNIYNWCQQYMLVIFVGITGGIIYNMIAGILRGLGDSVTALIFLLLTCAMNIGLDLWFVAGLGLGVFGVALATIIAQSISGILCLIKLLNMHDVFTLTRETMKPNGEIIRKVVGLGLPSGVTQGIFSLSIMLVQALTNSMGAEVIACSVVVMRVDSFAMMPFFSLGNAMTTYAGQNFGAKKLERLETGSRQGILMALLVSATLTALVLIFGRTIAGWFTETRSLIDLSMDMMRILAVGYLCMGVNQTMQGFLRGVGDTRSPMWISLFTSVGMRLPLAYLLAWLSRTTEWPNGQPYALYLSLVITWVIGTCIVFCVFRYRRRKLRANADESWQTEIPQA